MIEEFKILSHHGRQYVKDLRNQPVSELFRGRPLISGDITAQEINMMAGICPAGAISEKDGALDLGKCVFCKECAFLLPEKVKFLNDYKIAANRRDDLIIKPGENKPVKLDENTVRKEIRKLFSKALRVKADQCWRR